MERHVYLWIVVSMSKHYKNLTKRVGLLQSVPHYHLIKLELQKNCLFSNHSLAHYFEFLSFVGLVYMIFKHAVDRYNIYFAYKRSRINKYIHQTAINFVVISVIMLQCNIVFFTVVRSGKKV